MNWEELTSPEFREAVEKCGRVCVIPMGVIEKHGDHLPLGQDTISAQFVAREAAKQEPFMVFPFYYFGQNTHAKCEPGAIAIKFDLLHQLLESVCDEIYRNGFDKILVFNWHGGNINMLNYFAERMLDAEKPWSFYHIFNVHGHVKPPYLVAKYGGHACEMESSVMLAAHPELVKCPIAADYGMPQACEKAYRDIQCATPTSWYADHPRMLAADQTPGTAEKGRQIIADEVRFLCNVVKLLKSDETPVRLYHEFHQRCQAMVPRD